MPYRIDIAQPASDTHDQLIVLGALDVDASGSGLAALIPDNIAVEDIARAIGVTLVPGVTPAIGRDDDSVWVIRPRPIHIGRLTLLPADVEASSGLRLLDTPAFGTGLHPTTALCLEAIEEGCEVSTPERMLDVGTGSGVLAMAALHLGVAHVTAIDTDARAIVAARANGELNGMEERLALLHGGPEVVSGTWPFVVANILAAPLIEMAATLVQRLGRGATLMLSGIPESVAPDVTRCYTHLGLRLMRTHVRSGWVAVTLRGTW